MKLIKPTDHAHWLALRMQVITSTDVSALFGLSPYMTNYELWHRKKNTEHVIFEESERMKWGNRLESAIAHGIADDMGWYVSPLKEFGVMEDLRAGSSFDFQFTDSDGVTGLLEIKNVDGLVFKGQWITEGNTVIEAPPHIEAQVQHQLMVTGYPVAYIAALIGGNRVALLKRTPQENIIANIKTKITEFWQSIDDNQPPEIDFNRDADFIISLNQSANPETIMDLSSNAHAEELALEYQRLGNELKTIDEKRTAIKAELITIIGENEKAISDKFTISAGVVGPAHVEYDRAGYRNFRIFFKKVKT